MADSQLPYQASSVIRAQNDEASEIAKHTNIKKTQINDLSLDLTCNAVYQYVSLHDQRTYIRLLEILPGSQEDEIRCHLHITPLNCLPPYEALSYVWGTASNRSTIFCHDKPLSITRSLESALRRFRFTHETRMLWADAICINQQDLQERGNQVLAMRDIYQKALRVLVWLGLDEKQQAESAFRVARSLVAIISEPSVNAEGIEAFIEKTWTNEWRPFNDSLVQSWFRRVWVLQEVGLASDTLLIWGDAEICWDTWAKVCQYLANCREGKAAEIAFDASMNGVGTVASIDSLNFKGGSDMSIGQVLHLARNFRSTLPHDKVYGLLGHPAFRTFCINHQLDSFIPVDYTASYLDIYRAVAVRLLQEPNPLYCLCLSQYSSRRINLRPETDVSWVPQWTRSEPDLLHDQFEAHYTSGPTSPCFSVQGNALHIKGVVVDTVAFCTQNITMGILLRAQKGEPKEKDEHPFMTTWVAMRKARRGQQSEEETFEEICNTLSAGGCRKDEGRRLLTVTNGEQLADCFESFDGLGIPFTNKIDLAQRFTDDSNDNRFLRTIELSRFRCLFITEGGYLGLGPRVMRPKDVVCVLFGGPMPFILRSGTTDGEYKLRGESYVNGLMKGEAIKMWEAGQLEEREMRIV